MLQTYLGKLTPPELTQSVQNTVADFLKKLDQTKPKKAQNVLLLGNVQSGKTAQVLGILSALAERDYKVFLYLTTDSVDLQDQTFRRATDSLDRFIVLSENSDSSFMQVMKADKPILVIIKKNARALKRWRNLFVSQSYLKGYPLVIVDDEADAASLNTNADKPKEASTVNRHLDDIKNACCQSLFIQLTATPQSILLQSEESGWKPEFVHYFEAGEQYLGGKFVFSDPKSYIVRFVDSELEDMKDNSAELADGVSQALQSYLLTCAEFSLCSKTNCNFALHPSIKTADHKAFADKIQASLNDLVQALNNGDSWKDEFQTAYNDLKTTKPDIHHFEDIYAKLCELLEQKQFQVLTLNSKSEASFDLQRGFNIIVGGNVIGRGLTIPKLQTVYYSRTAKKPNADTFWQHARIFGYDRDKSLLRLYIPADVYRFFTTLSQANDLLIEQVRENYENIQMIYPLNVSPTRKNVLVTGSLNNLTGGINYFPSFPDEDNLNAVDSFIRHLEDGLHETTLDKLLEIIISLGNYQSDDWDKEKFLSSIQALQYQRPSFKSYVLVKRGRKLSKGTGTMLSEDDRKLGETLPDGLLLTLYQVTGTEKGWRGKPFWLPNIKLPYKGTVYWASKE